MANRYWISNANSNANVSTNWADNPDGTGANTVPVATDIVHFGHATTIANDLGAGICTWDLNIALDEMYVYAGYNDIEIVSDDISFSGSVITLETDAGALGIRVGMRITITNSTSNDGTYTITSITDENLTVSSSLTTEAAGATITLEYFASIDISSDFETNLLSLDGVLENTGGVLKTITLRGTPKVSSGSRYVLNGNNQNIRNKDKIAYDYRAKDSSPAYNDKILFDNGFYPIVKSTNGGTNFSSEYSIPTSKILLETSIYSLELTSSSCEFSKPASSSFTSQQNHEKTFYIETTSNFAMDFTPFDAGFSTWVFVLDATGFNFPVTADTTNYGTGGLFSANWYDVILDTTTAGYKATIPSNRTLNLNSITVRKDTVLQGYFTINENKTSTIVCVARPKILGSWNFSQLADGIYVSLIGDANPITHADGVVGRVQLSDGHGTFTSDSKLTWASATSELTINGKLTVTGLIDPTGLELTPQSSNPSNAYTLWVNSSDSNKLYYGASEVGVGGGGSGTVTSVAATVPTGFTITGSPITTSGTLAFAFDTGYSLPTTTKQGQWDTAYGWGDHAGAGYLTSFTESDPIFTASAASGILAGDITNWNTAYGWGDHSTQGYLTSTPPETDPVFSASEAALFQVGDAAKLAGIQAGAEVNVGLEYARWYGINTGANIYTISSGGRQYINWADAVNFAESSTGSHPSITLINAATDYITLAAGGIYEIVISMEMFPNPTSVSMDRWLEVNTNASANRVLGTARLSMFNSSAGNWNAQKTIVHEIPSTDPPLDVYVSVFTNGGNIYIRAFDDNRISISITRLGDSSV